MLNYLVAIEHKYERVPRQLVLYVGEAPMKMQNRIVASGLSFEVKMVDIRSVDGRPLLESNSLEDNLVSILARQPDTRRAVSRILEKIAVSSPEHRAEALQEVFLLARLRSLGDFVLGETRSMPILADIMDHDYLGPMIRRERAEGETAGIARGERTVLQKLLSKRFGTPPEWASQRISKLGTEQLEDLAVRLLDAKSLEKLFGAE